MALICATVSSAGSVLGIWQPQLIKSFGLTVMQTGLVNAIPYVIASVVMVWWGRHSDKKGERRSQAAHGVATNVTARSASRAVARIATAWRWRIVAVTTPDPPHTPSPFTIDTRRGHPMCWPC